MVFAPFNLLENQKHGSCKFKPMTGDGRILHLGFGTGTSGHGAHIEKT